MLLSKRFNCLPIIREAVRESTTLGSEEVKDMIEIFVSEDNFLII